MVDELEISVITKGEPDVDDIPETNEVTGGLGNI